MNPAEQISPRHVPALDPGFVPAVLWNRAYRAAAAGDPGSLPVALALEDSGGNVFVEEVRVLPPGGAHDAANLRYLERLLKFVLWQKGGYRVTVAGCPELAAAIAGQYCPDGARAFDYEFIGQTIYLHPMTVEAAALDDTPAPTARSQPLGHHLDGNRIGFDLGGSDRKCAAVVDGEVVFSDEVVWDPYFQSDPSYHIEGVHDSLQRAAAHLPSVDAIGGSAAGVYVDNEARAASLFRGVSKEDFDRHIKRMFFTLQERWGGVPFEVVNDGEVTALAGSMSLRDNAVLGVAMGTSQAAGYVDPNGHIQPWLDELAFVPIDYRDGGPVDEWSGDAGCGVQYFSQQAVARLGAVAGVPFAEGSKPAEKLVQVQELAAGGDTDALQIFHDIGTYFGYTIAHYADFYDFRHLLVLGRVTSGAGGEVIVDQARQVLRDEFPHLAEKVNLTVPDEKLKRHGQAIAAASLAESAR